MPGYPVMLVGNKADLRDGIKTDDYEMLYSANYWRGLVTTEEAEALARKHSMPYMECSALLQVGVLGVVVTAVRVALAARQKARKRSRFERKRHWRLFEQRFHSPRPPHWPPQEPALPPKEPEARVNVQTSTFGEDCGRLLQQHDTSCADVQFVCMDSSRPLLAHQVILSAASPVFRRIFTNDAKHNSVPQEYAEMFEEITWMTNHSGNDDESDGKVNIKLNKAITREVFARILQFLYTGMPGDLGVNEPSFLLEVKQVAATFQLLWLVQICENIVQEEESLNPSIGLWLNDETGARLRDVFLNRPTLSDVTFIVEGHVIYAHKAALMTRCDVMAAMFGGAFKESRGAAEIPIPDVKLHTFLAVLQYLYSDHVTFQGVDPLDILILADRLCIPRLVTLCEVALVSKVKQDEKNSCDVTKKVIQLLLTSQTYNASQLSQWCLRYIASHYLDFESLEDFRLLEGDNKDYVAQHRWPPAATGFQASALRVLERQTTNEERHRSPKCIMS